MPQVLTTRESHNASRRAGAQQELNAGHEQQTTQQIHERRRGGPGERGCSVGDIWVDANQSAALTLSARPPPARGENTALTTTHGLKHPMSAWRTDCIPRWCPAAVRNESEWRRCGSRFQSILSEEQDVLSPLSSYVARDGGCFWAERRNSRPDLNPVLWPQTKIPRELWGQESGRCT